MESYSNMKKVYLAKSPHEKWLFVWKCNNFAGYVIGCNFMDPKFKLSIRTLIPAFLLVNYFTLLIYTMCYYRNTPFQAIIATPALGLYVPCLVLFILIVNPSTRKKFRHMFNFAGDFIYANSDISPSTYRVCDRLAIDLATRTLGILMVLVFGFFSVGALPTYKLLHDGEKEMVLPVILPFVDPETNEGFTINLCNQWFSLGCGTFIIPATEIITCLLKNCISVSAAIIRNSLADFGTDLDGEFTNERSLHYVNIIKQILDCNRFIIDLTDLYYWKFFLQPLFLMYSVTMSIFLYLVGGWAPGIGCAICSYTQLMILCDIGHAVEDANEVIINAMSQFPFYSLPLKKQEMFGLILSCMQNGAKINIGPLAELNYETATKLTKTIYSYVMLMFKAY